MPAYSKEKEREFIGKIRIILVKKPDATIFQVQEILAKNKVKLDKNYVSKLIRKITQERANRYNNIAAKDAIAKFEDFIKTWEKELQDIINNPQSQKVKIAAIKQIIWQYERLLNMQFDAGVFERQLGKMKNEITNVSEILQAIENVKQDKKRNNGNDTESTG